MQIQKVKQFIKQYPGRLKRHNWLSVMCVFIWNDVLEHVGKAVLIIDMYPAVLF